jgi:hypothetical protein
MRILLDMVQADDKVLPNFIDLLYQLIDYYEGDGYALKCALAQEIPSLWDFERHPAPLPGEEDAGKEAKVEGQTESIEDDGPSERSKYREMRLGLQPPKEPASESLINVPKDPRKRDKYFAACYRSRLRAIKLLLRAGMTEAQIGNYETGQEEDPLETPSYGNGRGLENYRNNRNSYLRYIYYNSTVFAREKFTESIISTNLDLEAEIEEHRVAIEASESNANSVQNAPPSNNWEVPQPLIPPTPSSALRLDTDTATPRREDEQNSPAGAEDIDTPDIVPVALHGLLKADLFADAAPGHGFDVYGLVPEDQEVDDGGGDHELLDDDDFGDDDEEGTEEDDLMAEDDELDGEDDDFSDEEVGDDDNEVEAMEITPTSASMTGPTTSAQPTTAASTSLPNTSTPLQTFNTAQLQTLQSLLNAPTQQWLANQAAGPDSETQVSDAEQTQAANVGTAAALPAPMNALLQGLMPSMIARQIHPLPPPQA